MNDKTTLYSLRDREVISVCSGKRLGYVCDAEIDLCTGSVCSLILPGEIKCFGFSRGPDICVPWGAIEKIGNDVILVDSKKILIKEKRPLISKNKPD